MLCCYVFVYVKKNCDNNPIIEVVKHIWMILLQFEEQFVVRWFGEVGQFQVFSTSRIMFCFNTDDISLRSEFISIIYKPWGHHHLFYSLVHPQHAQPPIPSSPLSSLLFSFPLISHSPLLYLSVTLISLSTGLWCVCVCAYVRGKVCIWAWETCAFVC